MKQLFLQMKWVQTILQWWMNKKWREAVHYINGPETLPAPLSAEEEARVMENIRNNVEGAREPLITHNLRLVVYISKKFESSFASVEDLISIGTIGLIKAVNTFCPERNIKLATYASRCIENEILMYLRKSTQLKHEISIDDPLNVDWDGNELLLSDVLGSDPNLVNQNIEKQVERDLLMHAVSNLSQRKNDHAAAIRFKSGNRTHAKGSCRYFGNFSILYFTTGKKNHGTFKKRFRTGGIKYLCVFYLRL